MNTGGFFPDPATMLLNAVTAFSVTMFLLGKLSHVAVRIGLVDQPGRRKIHTVARPLTGGLSIMAGLASCSILFIPATDLRGLYAGLLLLTIVGFLDDFLEISHRWKFSAQIVASGMMLLLSSTRLTSFGDLLGIGQITFPLLAVPMTIFSTVGVINAFNMIDGIDGLAGGIALTAVVSFAALSFFSSQPGMTMLCLALCGSIVAFLRFNWHPSKVFMGDTGSLPIGFCLAFLSIAVTHQKDGLVPPVASLLIMTVPIVDTLTVMAKRVINGRSPFSPDKSHFHHILLKSGFTKAQVTVIILSVSLLFSSLAVVGTLLRVSERSLFLVFSVYFLSYFAASFFVKELIRFSRRQRKKFRNLLVAVHSR